LKRELKRHNSSDLLSKFYLLFVGLKTRELKKHNSKDHLLVKTTRERDETLTVSRL
jgi:hypothetical protein